MIYFCGGVVHKAVCEVTNEFLNDQDCLDIKQDHAEEISEANKMLILAYC